jgi:hypothetical protein
MKLSTSILSYLWLSNLQVILGSPAEDFASIVGSSLNVPTTTTNTNLFATSTSNSYPRTTSYITTVTFPNGGPTVQLLTKSTLLGPTVPTLSCTSPSCIQTIYTTGFAGLVTITTTSTTRYLTTSQQPNGAFTVFPTSSSTTFTAAYSGVPEVSMSTFLVGSTVTTTATLLVGGQVSTVTETDVQVATESVAIPVNAAAATARPREFLANAAALVAVGAAVVLL